MTAREYAQTLELLELHGIEATAVGHHGGASTLGKARAEARALPALRRWAKPRALRPRARARLARPDADRALARHPERDHVRLRVRLAPAPARLPRGDARRRPRGDPARAARPLRRAAAEAAPLPRPEGGVLPRRLRAGSPVGRPGSAQAAASSSAPPPEVSLYHRHGNPLFPRRRSSGSGRDERVHAVVLPRIAEQRERDPRRSACRPLVVPDRAVDAQSLIAAADRVVSAGGTMNREAVALGMPVYTDVRRPARRGGRAADPGRPARAARRSGRDSTCARRAGTRCERLPTRPEPCCSTSCSQASASAASTSSP